jgi:hypothetical protein
MKPFTFWTPLGLALIVVALAFWIIHQGVKLDSLESLAREKDAKITYWQTEAGKIVSSKPAAEIYPKNLENSYPELKKSMQDMKIQIRDLRAVLSAQVEAKGQGIATVVNDTIYFPGGRIEARDSLSAKDRYLDLRIAVPGGGFRYSYRDSLTFALHSKRKWFLGNKQLYGDISFANPHMKAVNQTSILIKERDRRFVLSAGVNYSPFDGRVLPGVHCGYALFKF